MSKPTFIRFNLGNLDPDDEGEQAMTCFFCKQPRCEQEFTCASEGGKKTTAVHTSCAEKHQEQESLVAKREKRGTAPPVSE